MILILVLIVFLTDVCEISSVVNQIEAGTIDKESHNPEGREPEGHNAKQEIFFFSALPCGERRLSDTQHNFAM